MKASKKIYALGFFDGVHLGHQALLEVCTQWKNSHGWEVACITFDRHPKSLFTPAPPALIHSVQDRETLLRHYGVEHIHMLRVTEETMSRHWRDFLTDLLEAGAAGFVCGHDFRFGHKGEGDAQKLQQFCAEHDLPCTIVPEQMRNGLRISSTHIRTLIEKGDMEAAADFLGHPHILSGEVVAGRQVGRTIGVPTANVLIPDDVVVPKLGVYACLCDIGGEKYPAVTNIGFRPTVGGHQTRAESWILDFAGDLYGQRLTLEFVKFLRPEQKFAALEELKAQIHLDAAEALRVLK